MYAWQSVRSLALSWPPKWSYLGVLNIINQWRTDPRPQVARATKFYTVVPNICVSSVWNWHHVILMAPRVLKPFLDVWKFIILISLRTQLIRGACAYLKLWVAYHYPILSLSTGNNGSYVLITCTVLTPALKSPASGNLNAVRLNPCRVALL